MNKKNNNINDFLKEIKQTINSEFKTYYNIFSLRNKQELEKLKNLDKQNVKNGWIKNDFDDYYNLFQDEINENLQNEIKNKRVLDNVLIPALKIEVDSIITYNHANDHFTENINGKFIKSVKNTKKYLDFKKDVYKQLEKSGINKIITKESTDLLKIKIYIQVKNTRKDTDNLEKTIIDTLSSYLKINDNKFKEKITKVIKLSDQSKKDVFVISIENLSEEEFLKDFIY